jgi:hypothetical protein
MLLRTRPPAPPLELEELPPPSYCAPDDPPLLLPPPELLLLPPLEEPADEPLPLDPELAPDEPEPDDVEAEPDELAPELVAPPSSPPPKSPPPFGPHAANEGAAAAAIRQSDTVSTGRVMKKLLPPKEGILNGSELEGQSFFLFSCSMLLCRALAPMSPLGALGAASRLDGGKIRLSAQMTRAQIVQKFERGETTRDDAQRPKRGRVE